VKTLLVTGAAGFLGWEVCTRAVSEGYRVYGLVHSSRDVAPGTEPHVCDLGDPAAVIRMIDDLAPQGIVHLAAVAEPNRCEQHPVSSMLVNVDASRTLAAVAAEAGIRLVFTSTDLVFGGDRAPYSEGDPVAPVNEYGRQKAAAEHAVLASCPDASVCRMPLMYGRGGPVSGSFLRSFCATLREGRPLRLFIDEYRTPVSGRDAAGGLLRVLNEGQGVYHLGGPERVSRYAFGLAMVEVFGFEVSLLEPVQLGDIAMAAPRAADVSLSSERAAKELGWAPGGVAEELAFLATQPQEPSV
jgi:dTDP-4-dehydrorhamnose reductase